MELSNFDFHLPEELIALEPLPRGTSRLLYVPSAGEFKDLHVSDLPSLLRPSDLLIFNDTKVIPARLKGLVDGRTAEITLHKKLSSSEKQQLWCAFCKPAKKFKHGSIFVINDNFSASVHQIMDAGEIIFAFNYDEANFFINLSKYGLMPLPPYISKKRKETSEDESTYQTIYANQQKQGSVAAPTAGLHFTDEILNNIRKAGADYAFVTLHVGGGTFLPVKTEDISQHKMHSEYFEIPSQTIEKIKHAKSSGGRIIAVGTTSLRSLESAADETGQIVKTAGDTKIFIYPTAEKPKYGFKLVNALFTNFHLPKSTLFMLVSSIATVEKAQSAYKHAIDKKYRFFSYGDACFFEMPL